MNSIRSALCNRLRIQFPIIQDGMGTFDTAKIAAAVSNSGGLGTASIPGMNIDPEEGVRQLKGQIERIASSTSRPFAVNIPVGRISTGEMLPTSEAYLTMVCTLKQSGDPYFSNLVAVTTSAGFPSECTDLIHKAGLIHIHKVGSVRHAKKAEEQGVDFIIASGYEMGGHTHALPVHTMILAPRVLQEVDTPVIISGGICDGYGLAAVLAMGGAGVAMGTRFIATQENDWHEKYKQKIVDAKDGMDQVIHGVYGPARFLYSKGIDDLKQLENSGLLSESDLASWKDLRMQEAMKHGDVENGLVPSGQVACSIKEIVRISEFIPKMADDAVQLLEKAWARVNNGGPISGA